MRPWEKYDSELTCYQEFGERIYPENSNCDRCNIITGTAIHSIAELFSVYPNPNSGRSIIEWSNSFQPERLNVYDLTGRIIYPKSNGKASGSNLDRSDLEKGVLVIEIVDKEGKKYKQQIIVL